LIYPSNLNKYIFKHTFKYLFMH